eukprot:6195697-Pleurochrysis_carterae.AAC.1
MAAVYFSSDRCAHTGKLRTLCGCDACLDKELVRKQAAREEEWALRRQTEKQAELAALQKRRLKTQLAASDIVGRPSSPSVAELQAVWAGCERLQKAETCRTGDTALARSLSRQQDSNTSKVTATESPMQQEGSSSRQSAWSTVYTEDGQKYFWRPDTDEVSWTLPAEGEGSEAEQAPLPAIKRAKEAGADTTQKISSELDAEGHRKKDAQTTVSMHAEIVETRA